MLLGQLGFDRASELSVSANSAKKILLEDLLTLDKAKSKGLGTIFETLKLTPVLNSGTIKDKIDF